MTEALGQTALQLYTQVASQFLPIPIGNQPQLLTDLEADPFVGHALSTASCELYHRYGMYLAPLTAALTTVRHCRVEEMRTYVIEDVGVARTAEIDCPSGGDTSGEV